MQFRRPMHNITSEGHVCNKKVFSKTETTKKLLRAIGKRKQIFLGSVMKKVDIENLTKTETTEKKRYL